MQINEAPTLMAEKLVICFSNYSKESEKIFVAFSLLWY